MIENFTGTYRFLSNFWPCAVLLDGVVYTSVEHAYQAAKTEDSTVRETIRNAPTPGEAKRTARLLSTDEVLWNKRKEQVMLKKLLRQKFFPGGQLANQLVATGVAVNCKPTVTKPQEPSLSTPAPPPPKGRVVRGGLIWLLKFLFVKT